MRTRRKNWTKDELDTNTHLISEPLELRGKWRGLFGNENEIYAELGCGKGSFLSENARRYPKINFIGIEREISVIASAVRLARESGGFPNLRFIAADAKELCDYFEDGELSRLYLNFSDPWPNRKKWAKRRLTHRNFLEIYERILNPVEIHLKTDNEEFFDFAIEQLNERGYSISELCRDLHSSEYAAANIMTEYERRFAGLGKPILRLVAEKK